MIDCLTFKSSFVILIECGNTLGVFFFSTFSEGYPWHQKNKKKKPTPGLFPGGSDGKASACNAGDPGSVPVVGRSPGEGNGNPLQYSCLENSMAGETWWATVHGVARVGQD